MIDFKVDKGILNLQTRIGIPQDFFIKLLNEDDWSFIIKLHALIEAACTHLILFHLKEPELSKIISRLELSNQTIGKLALLKALDLIGKNNRRYIISLSELRNSLVHDVRNSTFDLRDKINNFSKNELKKFTDSFTPWENTILSIKKEDGSQKNKIEIDITDEQLMERAKSNPKFHIWLGAHNLLVSLVDSYSYSDYKNWLKMKNDPDDIL